MAHSVQASAIDDSFEGLTNAPDAWTSGPHRTPQPVHYQHYVEPGDGRSAVDDRCLTEYGHCAYQTPRKGIEPAQGWFPKHGSPRKSSRTSSRGKRRPSPTFVIRGKNGERVVRSNPFVLRRSPQPPPRSSSSKETRASSDARSQHSARSKIYKIRINGKNGEEAVQEIRRPLLFTSSKSTRHSQEESTLVGTETASADEQDIEDRQRHSGAIDFVVPSSSTSSASSSLKMSGALPAVVPTATPHSSRSHLLPPSKPTSDFVHDQNPTKCHSITHHSVEASGTSTLIYELQPLSRGFSSSQPLFPSSDSTSLLQKALRVKTISGTSSPSIKSESSSSRSSWSQPSSPSKTSIKSPSLCLSNGAGQTKCSHDSESAHSLLSVSGNVSTISTDHSEPATAQSLPIPAASLGFPVSQISKVASRPSGHKGERPAASSVDVIRGKTPPESYYSWKEPEDSLFSSPSERSAAYSEIATENQSISSRNCLAPEEVCSAGAKPSSTEAYVRKSTSSRSSSATYQPRRSSSRSEDKTADHQHETLSSSGRQVPPSAVPNYLHAASSHLQSNKKTSSQRTPQRSSSASSSRSPVHAGAADTQSLTKHDTSRVSSNKTIINPMRLAESRTSRERQPEWTQSESRRSALKRSDSSPRTLRDHSDQRSEGTLEAGSPPPLFALTTMREEREPSLVTWTRHSPEYEGKTRYARAGAITPHPLSSVGRPETPKEPPVEEPAWQTDPKYQKPYVESASSSSDRTQGHDRRYMGSQARLLDSVSYKSAQEYGQIMESSDLTSARERRRRRTMERAAAGTW